MVNNELVAIAEQAEDGSGIQQVIATRMVFQNHPGLKILPIYRDPCSTKAHWQIAKSIDYLA